MRELFVRAISAQASMPAKCCNMIPLHLAVKYLTKDEAAKYRRGFEEWNTNAIDRIYCPNLRCSEFIPKRIVTAKTVDGTSNTFTCPKPDCATQICRECKGHAHPDQPCPQDTLRDEAIATVLKWGYKQCPRCGHGIRKMFGCSHMVCLCGAHFCWVCERGIHECEDDGGCIDEGSEYDYTDDEASVAEVEAPATDETPAVEPPSNVENTPLIVPQPPDQDRPPTPEWQCPTFFINPSINPETQEQAPPPPPPTEPAAASPEALSLEFAPTPTRETRPENLDRARPGFWEQQNLDFGEEPQGSDTTLWGCPHYWDKVDAKPLSVPFWERPELKDKKSKEPVEPECHLCWSVIEEAGWECTSCSVVFCTGCKEAGEKKSEIVEPEVVVPEITVPETSS
jgi:hypothetical protein